MLTNFLYCKHFRIWVPCVSQENTFSILLIQKRNKWFTFYWNGFYVNRYPKDTLNLKWTNNHQSFENYIYERRKCSRLDTVCLLDWMKFGKSGQIRFLSSVFSDFVLTWRMPLLFWCHTQKMTCTAHLKFYYYWYILKWGEKRKSLILPF